MLRLIPIVFFLVLFTVPAFAQENETETQIEIRSVIDDFFDSIGKFGQEQTNASTWFDTQKRDEINEFGESAITTGKTAFELWFNFHKLIVNLIFLGSPVPFDVGIIFLVSFVIGSILVFKLFWTFLKKIWKIVLVLIAIIAVIVISGIEFPSVT